MVDREDRATDAEGPFRIASVAEATGVPEPTLRAWERRYGIPSPERTDAGYRLYGRAEIAEVREMRRLCDEGMAASEAAGVLLARRGGGRGGERQAQLEKSPFELTAEAIVRAVEHFDDDALEAEVRRLLVMGSGSMVFDRAIAPALDIIGQRWHAGELSVAQEHFASQRFETLLRDLLRLSPGASADARVVLGSFADDEHQLGLLGTAIRLADWGLRPVLLGARTPPSAIRGTVAAVSPELVALSVTLPPTRVRARELVEEYAAACGTVPWLVGGAAAASVGDLVSKMGGHVAPPTTKALYELVRSLTGGTRKASARVPTKRRPQRSR